MQKSDFKIVLTKEESDFIDDLIKTHYVMIEKLINRFACGDLQIAEEAVSELYLLMCKKAKVLNEHPSPKAWIIRASKYIVQGLITKNSKEKASVSIEVLPECASETDVFEDVVYSIWMEENVPDKVLSHLTKREREVYQGIYIENKKPKEVASDLNISVNAVNNIHKNLRDKIKDDIKRKNFEEFIDISANNNIYK